jgi:hypothetical protein
VHTDHQKLTFEKSTSDRVMCWRLLIEGFGPEFRHVKGKHNLIADALSRLDLDSNSRTKIINDILSPTDGFEMAKAFGIKSKKKTKDEDYEFPMQIPYIAKMQDKDNSLMKELIKSDLVRIN